MKIKTKESKGMSLLVLIIILVVLFAITTILIVCIVNNPRTVVIEIQNQIGFPKFLH